MAGGGSAVPGLIAESSGPLLVVIAGPGGAGKTTFFKTQLAATGLRFVNADLLARELRPDNPAAVGYAAAQLADQTRHQLIDLGVSFCVETVFSDPAGDKRRFIRQAMAVGYHVVLIVIGTESAELCQARVLQRVSEGGHDVPDNKLMARLPRSMRNLRLAVPIVDHANVFDNSSLPIGPTSSSHITKRGPSSGVTTGFPGDLISFPRSSDCVTRSFTQE